MYIENIVIGKPIVEPSTMFAADEDDWERNEKEKTFNDCNEIGTITWLLEEFKYFLNALSFSEDMTNRIVYLEKGEKVIDENGEVIYESK